MLSHIQVTPLASESLGARSMCTYVKTSDVGILLDAGVSLCPDRFGLPPHPAEFNAIDESRKRIAEFADRAEVVTLSHYHFDHHTPSFKDWLCNWTEYRETAKQIYCDKMVLMKNPNEMINYSQRQRAWMFQITAGKHARKLETADGKTFSFGVDTRVHFSEPVFHGSDGSELGWVLITTIECRGEKFLFAPDVQGPMSERSLKLIIDERPHLIMIGGPPTYLVDFKVNRNQLQSGLKNLARAVETVPQTILEHHILRDENWKAATVEVFKCAAEAGHEISTAAEYSGRTNTFLEASRKKLFAEDKPTKQFEKWMNQGKEARRQIRPPI